MHFYSLRKMHNYPAIKLEGTKILIVDEYKFLGVIFNKTLSFIPHLKHMKSKGNKVLQPQRVVTHTKWGANWQTLKLYWLQVCSQLNYGSFVYRSIRKSYLKDLDPIQNEGLTPVLGAFKTSPMESLYAEIHEALLQLRSEKLALHYYTKLKIGLNGQDLSLNRSTSNVFQ